MLITHDKLIEKLPSEIDEMECSMCGGDCFVDCMHCGGDGDIECPVCGGVGEKGIQEDGDSDCNEVHEI